MTLLEELQRKLTEVICSMSWLEEMNPLDQPAYKVYRKQIKELEKQIKEAKANDSSANNKSH